MKNDGRRTAIVLVGTDRFPRVPPFAVLPLSDDKHLLWKMAGQQFFVLLRAKQDAQCLVEKHGEEFPFFGIRPPRLESGTNRTENGDALVFSRRLFAELFQQPLLEIVLLFACQE